MSTPADSARTARTVTSIVAAVMLLVLVGIGVAVFRSVGSSAAAEDKAEQFIAALDQAGLRKPSRDQVVGVLGDDGGAVCANPNSALGRALLYSQLANGAGGPGTRPIITSNRVVRGEQLVLQIYCPDKLAGFTQVVDDLKYGSVLKG
jgi:hypothetical protein